MIMRNGYEAARPPEERSRLVFDPPDYKIVASPFGGSLEDIHLSQNSQNLRLTQDKLEILRFEEVHRNLQYLLLEMAFAVLCRNDSA